jgi:DNA-binding XRE family transcriptional regulator
MFTPTLSRQPPGAAPGATSRIAPRGAGADHLAGNNANRSTGADSPVSLAAQQRALQKYANEMSSELSQSPPSSAESPDATLAKNLVAARTVAGITQQELADASGISRATVAQIETGSSDPRLSTIVQLAKALGIAPIVLLMGRVEILALAGMMEPSISVRPSIDSRSVARMQQHLATGMLKDRLRAARIGANAVESSSASTLAPILAGVISAILPGIGTEIGARLGDQLAVSNARAAQTPRASLHKKA